MSIALRHRNLPQLMLQAREALMLQFRPVLHAHGVTEQQWRVLRELLQQGSSEPHQLCAQCQISSPSITGVLLRMEAAGWLARERIAEDQRRVRVSLTARGRQLAQRIAPDIEARYVQIEQRVGVAVLQQVHDALDTLLEPLTEPSPASRARRSR
jgi:homoprotocatechuate degradation regulator HpaR